MGKNEPLTEEQRMESSSYDDDIKQSLLYWKIANATGISIDDRCIYLLKRGMTEKDIDVMLSILKEEQRQLHQIITYIAMQRLRWADK